MRFQPAREFDGLWIGYSSNVTVTGNDFTNNGLLYGDPIAAGLHTSRNDLSGFVVSGNNFIGNQNGITHDDVDTLDAQYNYWGCWEGAGADGCDIVDGNVDVTPYLTVSIP